MLDTNDTEYYNVNGIQIIDPSINYDEVLLEGMFWFSSQFLSRFSNTPAAPSIMAVNQYNNILSLNASYLTFLNDKAASCGFTSFMENSLVFPPKGPLPSAPEAFGNGCDVFDDFTVAATYVNPCYNVYHITDFCPFLWDELGLFSRL